MSRVRTALLSLACALTCACSTTVRGSHREVQGYGADNLAGGQFNALVGQRSLEDSAPWGELSEQLALGIDFVLGPDDDLLQWDWALHYAWDETELGQGSSATDATSETVETSLGLLWLAGDRYDALVPYLGAGGSLLYVQTEALAGGAVDDGDWSFGAYARAGLLVRLNARDHFGIDVRYLAGTDLDIAGSDVGVDALVISLVLGNQF